MARRKVTWVAAALVATATTIGAVVPAEAQTRRNRDSDTIDCPNTRRNTADRQGSGSDTRRGTTTTSLPTQYVFDPYTGACVSVQGSSVVPAFNALMGMNVTSGRARS